ncbi:MAG: DUF4396 domain-containing protein [Halodesulfurarchaeum sp.]
MAIEQVLTSVLTDPQVLIAWAVLVVSSLAVLGYDLYANNRAIAPLMKFVWVLTVLYSGPIGLAIYAYSGRRQISQDSFWRKGFRSVAHCYSGCGAGEVLGVTVAAGILTLSQNPVIVITFTFAYIFGYAMTVGPLVQEGVGLKEALYDGFLSETPSITVMEVVAIGTDVWLAGDAHMGDVLFWSALIFSLTLGLVAAYPVNLFLIDRGVKEGMQNPADIDPVV